MKISCGTAQDLIPGYAEDLLSKDSNELIEEHIKDCPECTVLLENMKSEAEKTEAEILEASLKEIEPLKKYRRRINIGNFICGLIGVVFALSVSLLSFITILEYYYDYRAYYIPHEIYSLISEDSVTGELLILPFSYKEGLIRHNGHIHNQTIFLSDETVQELSDRINALKMADCTASVFNDTTVLVRFRNANYRLVRNYDEETWYSWELNNLSYKTNERDIIFPLFLCKDAENLSIFTEPVGWYTVHSFEDFVKFYEETGFYIIEVKENTIRLLGYSDSRNEMQEYPFAPLNIIFTEYEDFLTISVTDDEIPDTIYY